MEESLQASLVLPKAATAGIQKQKDLYTEEDNRERETDAMTHPG